jgi:hypothetical protein
VRHISVPWDVFCPLLMAMNEESLIGAGFESCAYLKFLVCFRKKGVHFLFLL